MYHYSWFFLIPGVEDGSLVKDLLLVPEEAGSAHIIPASWFVFLVLTVVAFAARSGLAAARARGGTLQYVPSDSLGPRGAMELVVEGLLNFAENVLGSRKYALQYFPLFATLFIYILASNLLGLVPGFLPPTNSMSNNFAMAAVVFVVFNYAGLKEDWKGYLGHIAGPVWWLAPVLFVLESVSILIRPLTLSLRLFINMFADHLLLGVSTKMVAYVLPSFMVGLGFFVALVQAFVFMLLAVVYVALSVPHDEHHH